MRKGLRTLCLGVLAAVTAVSSAQVDVTNKYMLNADIEKGLIGWELEFAYADNANIWNKQTKGEEKAAGYYGFNNLAIENWRGSGNLTDGAIYQSLKGLPNGTYVFGAYAMATNHSWTANIDDIQGVSIFANEKSIRVATNRIEGMGEKWAHTKKFNVAAIVTDGTLKVGMQTKATNASFVAMDNATLWYFEDMDTTAALNAMARADIDAVIEKMTLFRDEASKMNADTLNYLNEAIVAAQGEVSVANVDTLVENLYWGKRQAIKSIEAYAKLATALEAANTIANMEWSEDIEETVAALEALKELIAACEEKYNEGSALNAEATEWVALLEEAGALVELDAYYLRAEDLMAALDTLELGDEIGQFAYNDYDRGVACYDEVLTILSEASAGEISAKSAKTQCDVLFKKMEEIMLNPINYYEFPIFIGSAKEPLPNQKPNKEGNPTWAVLEGAYETDEYATGDSYKNLIEFKSPLYRFREPLTTVRFYIRAVGDPSEVDKNQNPHICISGFAMYDEEGEPIELTTENVVSNATENEGQGIPGMLDYLPNTFFHSLWRTGTPEAHYIEVTLPEGEYTAFSFKMLSFDNTRSRVFPKELEITHVSEKVTELQQLLVKAKNLNPIFGTGVGFVNVDPAAYEEAIAEGDAVATKNGATDADAIPAINKLLAVYNQIVEAGVKMPEAGKKYRIISGEPRFFTNQNIVKALTLHTDTIYGDWLWWETAHADSARQEFIVEHYSTHGDRAYYTFKHAQTGLYLGEIRDSLGNLKEANRFVFTERVDSFWLKSLGQGQFGIMASDGNSRKQFNTEFHNNGAWSDQEKNYGAIAGVKSYIHTWDSGANQSSAWFFREMVQLPQAAKSISELNFRSEAISIYEGVNILTITADKDCAFADLKVVDVFGKDVAIDAVAVEGKVATVTLSKCVETFAVIFTNNESVEEITIDGIYVNNGPSAAYKALQNTYNTVLALAPVEGTEVGQVADLSKYDNALTAADALLTNGAEDAELEAAKAALEDAQKSLQYNLPKADTDYLILLGNDNFKNNTLVNMAVYADGKAIADGNIALRWTYVSLTNPEFRWRFIDCGELKYGRPAYYIQSVVTGGYVTRTVDSGATIFLSADSTQTRPYDMFFKPGGKVAVTDTHWANGDAALHPNNHGNGANDRDGGRMITWGHTDANSAMYIVEAEKFITDMIYSINDIEEIEVAGEAAPAVKGIFDLFGRRIEAPATTGIYIVDGKKKVIKK